MTTVTDQYIRQYSIQAAANRLGISAGTLRRWETVGAIPKAWRTPGGQRRYSEADLASIKAHLAEQQGPQHG